MVIRHNWGAGIFSGTVNRLIDVESRMEEKGLINKKG